MYVSPDTKSLHADEPDGSHLSTMFLSIDQGGMYDPSAPPTYEELLPPLYPDEELNEFPAPSAEGNPSEWGDLVAVIVGGSAVAVLVCFVGWLLGDDCRDYLKKGLGIDDEDEDESRPRPLPGVHDPGFADDDVHFAINEEGEVTSFGPGKTNLKKFFLLSGEFETVAKDGTREVCQQLELITDQDDWWHYSGFWSLYRQQPPHPWVVARKRSNLGAMMVRAVAPLL